ncbi:MAG: FG-GAP repeat domain-containing protein [Gemmataceae bacterium]
MRLPLLLLSALGLSAATLSVLPAADTIHGLSDLTWKKTTIDAAFRSEGATAADVNKDGKVDILNGECWYEAPTWKRHEITKSKDWADGPKNVYSDSFACWADDLNGDGYPDLIVINFPGAPCHWFENPKGKEGHWKRHVVWHSACNETPQYLDLLGTGKKVLIMGWQPKGSKGNQGQMAYFTPDANDPTVPWVMNPISEESQPGKEVPGTQRFSHGLGAGDLNGDGRLDVITTGGWWEQPEKAAGSKTPWAFHPLAGIEPSADMHAYDLNGDGRSDILCSSAHKFGIWSFEQRASKPGASPAFIKQDLFPQFVSETHAMVLADLNGDGAKDFVTGKRWWSHGRAEPGADWPAMLYWFQARKVTDGPRKGQVTFTPRVIDTDSGVGTQFAVADVNGDGLLDVVTSNKRGTYLFEQGKKPAK